MEEVALRQPASNVQQIESQVQPQIHQPADSKDQAQQAMERFTFISINGLIGVPEKNIDLFLRCKDALEVAAHITLNFSEHKTTVEKPFNEVTLLTAIIHASEFRLYQILELLQLQQEEPHCQFMNKLVSHILTKLYINTEDITAPLGFEERRSQKYDYEYYFGKQFKFKALQTVRDSFRPQMSTAMLQWIVALNKESLYKRNTEDSELMKQLQYGPLAIEAVNALETEAKGMKPDDKLFANIVIPNYNSAKTNNNQANQSLMGRSSFYTGSYSQSTSWKAKEQLGGDFMSYQSNVASNQSNHFQQDLQQNPLINVKDKRGSQSSNLPNAPNIISNEDLKLIGDNVDEQAFLSKLANNKNNMMGQMNKEVDLGAVKFTNKEVDSTVDDTVTLQNGTTSPLIYTTLVIDSNQGPNQKQQLRQIHEESKQEEDYDEEEEEEDVNLERESSLLALQQNKSEKEYGLTSLKGNRGSYDHYLNEKITPSDYYERHQTEEYVYTFAMSEVTRMRNYVDNYLKQSKDQIKCKNFDSYLERLKARASKLDKNAVLQIRLRDVIEVEQSHYIMHRKHLASCQKAQKYSKRTSIVQKQQTANEVENNDVPLSKQHQEIVGAWNPKAKFNDMTHYGEAFVPSFTLARALTPIRLNQTAKESGILYRYPRDMDYNKYNFVDVTLNELNIVEKAILQEMIQHNEDVFHDILRDHESHSTTGSPFFFQGNYRMAYFPFKFLRDQYDMIGENNELPFESQYKLPFQTYQSKNLDKVFNSYAVFKKEKRQNYNTYYLYEDELMCVANILMDGVVYNDRRCFIALIACLYPPVKSMILNQQQMSPDYFPFVDVMNCILFNRHLNNYNVECFYDSEVISKDLIGERLWDMTTIVEDNIDIFKPILQKGSVIVEFSYFFTKVRFPQVHFVVVRLGEDKRLYMQSSKSLSQKLPLVKLNQSYSGVKVKYLKDDLFCDPIQGNRYKIDVYRVRFYSCMRLEKIPCSQLTKKPLIYHYNLRNSLVLFFSMQVYNLNNFRYSLIDIERMCEAWRRGAADVWQIADLLQDFLERDHDSDASLSDDHENHLETYKEKVSDEMLISQDELDAAQQEFDNDKNITLLENIQSALDSMNLECYNDYMDFVYSYASLKYQQFKSQDENPNQLKNSLLLQIEKTFEAVVDSDEYICLQTKERMSVIRATVKLPHVPTKKVSDYLVSLDISYWIANDRYIPHNYNLYTDEVMNMSEYTYSFLENRLQHTCKMPLKTIRKWLKLNYINPNTQRNYRSMYTAPKVSLVEKQQVKGFWHGYGYYKTNYKHVSELEMLENKTVMESIRSRPSSRSSKSSQEPRATRDEEEEPLQEVKHLFLKKKNKGRNSRYEIVNRFEEHFYEDIGANLLYQAGIKKRNKNAAKAIKKRKRQISKQSNQMKANRGTSKQVMSDESSIEEDGVIQTKTKQTVRFQDQAQQSSSCPPPQRRNNSVSPQYINTGSNDPDIIFYKGRPYTLEHFLQMHSHQNNHPSMQQQVQQPMYGNPYYSNTTMASPVRGSFSNSMFSNMDSTYMGGSGNQQIGGFNSGMMHNSHFNSDYHNQPYGMNNQMAPSNNRSLGYQAKEGHKQSYQASRGRQFERHSGRTQNQDQNQEIHNSDREDYGSGSKRRELKGVLKNNQKADQEIKSTPPSNQGSAKKSNMQSNRSTQAKLDNTSKSQKSS